MKKIIIMLLIAVVSFMQQSYAQPNNNSQINNVLSAYLNLKNALVANDAQAASSSAQTMLDEINRVPMDKMTTEQHSIWMKYKQKLSFDSRHISEVNELDRQREYFTSLSKSMFLIIKIFPGSTTIYYQFCPMANESKGAYWLSEDSKVHNPYFGNNMNGCSSTKETIQAK